MRRPVLLSVLPALLPITLVALAGPAGAAPADDLSLSFTTSALVNDGTAGVQQRVVSSGGGTAVLTAAPGAGALQLPAFSTARVPVRAVLAVTATGAVDPLAPGEAAFAFGADVRLDARNRGSSSDNGNNVVQRGLWGSGAQYKLELEAGQAVCRVEGLAGSVQVATPVPAEAWHRLACSVSTGPLRTMTLTATALAADGSLGVPAVVTATGSIGTLRYARTVPLSVGGKLTATGALVGSSDQFNGRVDEVWYHLG